MPFVLCALALAACSADQGAVTPDAGRSDARGDGSGGGSMDGGGGDGASGGMDATLAGDGSSGGDAVSTPDAIPLRETSSGGDGTTSGDDGGTSTGGDGSSGGDAAIMTGCGATEVCHDGRDNNCDGRIDEDCVCEPGMTTSCFVGFPAQGGVGACVLGIQRCLGAGEFGTWGPCTGSGTAGVEACDGRDNDCNGTIDDVPPRPCYTGSASTRDVGECRAGTQACVDAAWDVCTGSVLPGEETCDGRDNDCDGMVDDLPPRSCYSGAAGTAGVGPCRAGTQACIEGVWDVCTGSVVPSMERCDTVDNNCNGTTDEGCSCAAGQVRPCGVSVGACRQGTETCSAAGTWGMCTGATGPSDEVCDGVDNNCNGATDEGLTSVCYPGPAGTVGVGQCHGGVNTCSGGSMTGCAGAVTPVSEVCDNHLDDDCDGMVDEDCAPCIMGTATSSPWQIHRVQGPVCFGRAFGVNGDVGEYEFAVVPSEGDPGWRPVASSAIDFGESSALCGRSCTCLDGGEFTFFQTFFDITPGYAVSSLIVNMDSVDDGARVTVFNSAYPGGVTDPGAYIQIGRSSATADIGRYIVPGRNRILITHVDDCCSARSLAGVRVVLNGGSLRVCP